MLVFEKCREFNKSLEKRRDVVLLERGIKSKGKKLHGTLKKFSFINASLSAGCFLVNDIKIP